MCAYFPTRPLFITLIRWPRHHTGIQNPAGDLSRWDHTSYLMAQAPTGPTRSHAPREHRGHRSIPGERPSKAASGNRPGRSWDNHPTSHPKCSSARRVGQRRDCPCTRLAAGLVSYRLEAPQGRRIGHFVRLVVPPQCMYLSTSPCLTVVPQTLELPHSSQPPASHWCHSRRMSCHIKTV